MASYMFRVTGIGGIGGMEDIGGIVGGGHWWYCWWRTLVVLVVWRTLVVLLVEDVQAVGEQTSWISYRCFLVD